MLTATPFHRRFRWLRLAILLFLPLLFPLAIFAQQTDTFGQAGSLFNKGRSTEAAPVFSTAAREGTEPGSALLDLAKAQIHSGRFGAAEITLRRYLALPEATGDGQYLLAYVLFRQGRASDSLAAYELALQRQTPASDDLKIIGLDYGLLNDFERSAAWLQKALMLDAGNLEARYYLGRVRYTQNRFADAITEFEAVLARDPQHIKAQNNLGQALEGINDIDAAFAAYRRAIELDRGSPKPSELPLLNLAVLYLQRDQVAEALPLLIRAVAINPLSASVHFQLGKVYFRQSRLDEAEKELLAATRLAPDDKGAHYQLGRLYHRLGKAEQARRELEISERLTIKGRP